MNPVATADAPYPADTRAKGWRFELDLERVRQSDTWALAKPEDRPWLLMLWATAWEQVPCGSLPASDELIAARIGMTEKAFAKSKHVLLRGWHLASDGRLYHATITQLVLAMIGRKDAERKRKSEYRARMSGGCPTGQPRDSTGSDATGTGTGIGDTEDYPHLAGGRAQGADDPDPEPIAVTPTDAGLVCRAIRRAGVQDVNPGHPMLLALLEAGATEAEFVGFATKARDGGRGFAWVIGAVKGERERAASAAAGLHRGPMVARSPPNTFAAHQQAKADAWMGTSTLGQRARAKRADEAAKTDDSNATIPTLPLRYVDEIHARLLVRYGIKWLRLWEGIDERAVKDDWAMVCGRMTPTEIRKALDSLPDDQPPTAPQFRKLGHTPESHALALPPAVDPAGMRRVASELRKLPSISGITLNDLLQRQRARREAGNLTPAQRDWLRTVEEDRAGYVGTAALASITPVHHAALPPGMRE